MSICSPSAWIRPVCSASSMKCCGGTAPSSGCVQRTSASNDESSPVCSLKMGWYSRRICSVPMARRSACCSATRSPRPSTMSARKNLQLSRPAFLASYNAMSACFSSDSTSAPSSGNTLTPMLADMANDCSSIFSGWRMASSTRCATPPTFCRSPGSLTSSTNSSPPMRTTMSPPAMLARSRRAVSRSSSSPAACPRVSLIDLNWSRSRNSSARRRTGCRGTLQQGRQVIAQEQPVGQARQRIVSGQVLQRAAMILALGLGAFAHA